MNRDWTDFKALHSNLPGAREAFENACESLFKKEYSGQHVSQMRVTVGDGGIDVFVGEFGVEPITVIQCKFFLESFDESQKSQIRESFKSAVNSEKYELKEWILCVPRVIDVDENSWWFKWKHKQLKTFEKDNGFIKLENGNSLIDLLKKHDLYNTVFQITDSIKLNEIHQEIVKKKPASVDKSTNLSLALFNHYTEACEPYYYNRIEDNRFIESLKLNNVWLFGKSGVGKTALINRNLLQNKIPYCYCDLSPISIASEADVFLEILHTLENRFNTNANEKEANVLKKIAGLLIDNGPTKMVIVIDELSVREEGVLKSVIDGFSKLVTHCANKSGHHTLKFVISTISNPNQLFANRSKAYDYFQLNCCDDWTEGLPQLFDLLNHSLPLNIDSHKDLIVSSAESSPRTLKSILRKLVVLGDDSEDVIKLAINQTLDETI